MAYMHVWLFNMHVFRNINIIISTLTQRNKAFVTEHNLHYGTEIYFEKVQTQHANTDIAVPCYRTRYTCTT